MTFVSKSAITLSVAGVMTLFMPALSGAQQMQSNSPADTWSYTVNPGPDGKCWVQTDAAYSQRGFGYWGNCPGGATASASSAANTASTSNSGHQAYARAHKRVQQKAR